MAIFPALTPSTRTYTPGQHSNTPIGTLNGDELGVRHGNAAVSNILRMSFGYITRADHYSIVSHYYQHDRFVPFDLSSTTLSAVNIAFPAGYQWIYAGSPRTNETCSEITVTVELELIPTYTI
jgi:hypothetical protein